MSDLFWIWCADTSLKSWNTGFWGRGVAFHCFFWREEGIASHWKMETLLDLEEINEGWLSLEGWGAGNFQKTETMLVFDSFSITGWKYFFGSESDSLQLFSNKILPNLFSRKVLSAFYWSEEEKTDQL